MAVRAPFGVVRRAKVIKDFSIRTARITDRRGGFGTSSAPPVFFAIVEEDAALTHALSVAVGLRTYFNLFGRNILASKQFSPQLGGFGIFGDIKFFIAQVTGHVEFVRVKSHDVGQE